jgi:hypothetical protein
MVEAMQQHKGSLLLPASGSALLCMIALLMACLPAQLVAGAFTHECDLLVDAANQVGVCDSSGCVDVDLEQHTSPD